MTRASITLFALFLIACAPAPYEVPHQDEAAHLVWVETFHMTSAPLTIEWVPQAYLDCSPDAQGQMRGWMDAEGCTADYTWPERKYARVALPDDYALHEVAFAHAHLHAKLLEETGDGDAAHHGAEWGAGGLLERANTELKARGM